MNNPIKELRIGGLILGLMLAFCADAFSGERNYVENGSFELGEYGWASDGGGSDKIVYQVEECDTPLGKKALLLAYLYDSATQSMPFIIPGKKSYTLSWYMKAKKEPSPEVAVGLLFINPQDSKLGNFYWANGAGQRFDKVNNEWKRYSVNVPQLPEGEQVGVQIAIFSQGPGVYFDGIQLEEGDLSDYKPYESVQYALSTDKLGNLFDAGEGVKVKIGMENNSGKEEKIRISYEVKDYDKKVVKEDRFQVLLPEGITGREVDVGLNKRGYYEVSFTFEDTQGNKKVKEISLGKIVKQDSHKIGDDSPWGMMTRWSKKGFLIGSQVGVKWWRYNYDIGHASWYKGEQRLWEWLASFVRSIGGKLMPVGDGIIGCPGCGTNYSGWNLETGEWNKEAKELIKKLTAQEEENADRWRWLADECMADVIKDFEIWNEVYYPAAPEEYVKVQEVAYRAIKQKNSKAIVVANVVDAAPHEKLHLIYLAYLERFLKAGGADSCDVIATHPYVCPLSPEEGDIVGHIRRIREIIKTHAGRDIPVWDSEVAYPSFGDCKHLLTSPHYDFAFSKPECLAITERVQSDWTARQYIMEVGEGLQKIIACVLLGQGPLGPAAPNTYLHNDFSPKPELIAYNTLTRHLIGVTPRGHIGKKGDLIYAYAFQKGPTNMVAYWHADSNVQNEGKLLLNTKLKNATIIDLMDNETEISGKVLPITGSPRFIMSETLEATALLNMIKEAQVKDLVPTPKIQVSGRLSSLSKIKITIKNIVPLIESRISGIIKAKNIPDGWQVKEKEIAYGPLNSQEEKIYYLDCFPPAKLKAFKEEYFNLWISNYGAGDLKVRFTPILASYTDGPAEVNWGNDYWQKSQPLVLDTKERTGIPKGVSFAWGGKDDLSALLYHAWDSRYLYLKVDVKDNVLDTEAGEENKKKLYMKDSLQIVFDVFNIAREKGPEDVISYDDYWHYAVGICGGKAKIYKGRGYNELNLTKVDIQRTGDNHTIYKIAIPQDSLKPFELKEGNALRYNLIVNDADGSGRKQWIGITKGIGEGPNPGLFWDLVLTK